MTNKYEQAADDLHSDYLYDTFADHVSLALSLLRAAARLPEGVDAVQVLNEYAAWERRKRTGAQGQSNPPAPKQPTFPSPEEQERIFAATNSLGNPPAPAEDANASPALQQLHKQVLREVNKLRRWGANVLNASDVVHLVESMYKAGFEAGQKAGGK